MGEAKRRGTFEERKRKAIEREKLFVRPVFKAESRNRKISPLTTTILMAAAIGSMAALKKEKRT